MADPVPVSLQEQSEDEPTKAYYVDVPIRGYSIVMIRAANAAEAVAGVAKGRGEGIGSDVDRVGKGRARRAPEEDL